MSKHKKDDKEDKGGETLRAFARLSQIGFTMAVSILLSVLLGKYLDDRLGTSPFMLLLFSLLGAGAAIKLLFDMGNKKD